MKRLFFLSILSSLFCGGCTIPQMAMTGGMMYATKPDALPAADTQSQIPAHESWCYSTIGHVQCYTKAQAVNPNRLINVDPQNRYPLTSSEYQDEIEGKRIVTASAGPEALAKTGEDDSCIEAFFKRNFGF